MSEHSAPTLGALSNPLSPSKEDAPSYSSLSSCQETRVLYNVSSRILTITFPRYGLLNVSRPATTISFTFT